MKQNTDNYRFKVNTQQLKNVSKLGPESPKPIQIQQMNAALSIECRLTQPIQIHPHELGD